MKRLKNLDADFKEIKEKYAREKQNSGELRSDLLEERRAKDLSNKYLTMVKVRLSGIVTDLLTTAGLLNEFR